MAESTPPAGLWRKSSHSGGTGNNCVQILVADDVVLIRDSADPGGAVLRFGRSQWRDFIHAVKRREFDA